MLANPSLFIWGQSLNKGDSTMAKKAKKPAKKAKKK
jgi:hypothetical protein